MKDKIFAEIEDVCNEMFRAHHENYRLLTKYGPNMFEDDGMLLAIFDGVEKRKDGRVFILKTLIYFETKDEAVFYRWCAKLKRVLDHYDERFKTTDEQKSRSEEIVQPYKLKERELKEFMENARIVHSNNSQGNQKFQ